MKTIRYLNPDAGALTIHNAAVSPEPLQAGAVYTVSDETAAELLGQMDWSDEDGAATHARSIWEDVDGIDDEIAAAIEYIGIHTPEDLRAEIAEHGDTRLRKIPGIGPMRFGALRQFAEERE